jgi:ABC-type nitrate/sulfonate/bicarbonate transport system permease component
MSTPRKSLLITLEVVTPLVLVAIWWFATADSTSAMNPSLASIMERFADNWFGELFATEFLPSLTRMLIGYGLAIILGVGLGMLLGLSSVMRRLTSPLVSFLRSIPGAALLPPAVLLLGVGPSMKIAIIAFICLWPILLNTIDGVDETHATMTNTAKVLAIRGPRRFFQITVPAAGPRIFTGMRTSLALALIMLVISEMIASTEGLGFFILQAQRTFDTADMWSGIILLGLLGYVLTLVFTLIERTALGWYLDSKKR